MIQHSPRDRIIASALAALAGYVDAIGFLELGGFFVSFMSGNSTRLGVELHDGARAALVPAALIGLFVLGVVAGSLTGHAAQARRRTVVLLLVATLIAIAALFATLGLKPAAIVCIALAMGAENAVFERNGEVTIGVTYMTGALVKLGQRLTAALLGGHRWAWIWYLVLWLGLVAGAIAGAGAYAGLGLRALWIAAAAAALLAWLIDRPARKAG